MPTTVVRKRSSHASLSSLSSKERKISEVDSRDGPPNDGSIEVAKAKSRNRALFNKLKRVHEDMPSLFSSTSGFQNYRGILNLCILIMILSNFRVALDNILKYGVLVDPKILLVFLEDPYSWPCASLVVALHIFIQIAFYTETLLSNKSISEKFGGCIHVLNITTLLLFPVSVILTYHPAPWSSTAAMMIYLSVKLKLISYVAVNRWCREEKEQLGGKRQKVEENDSDGEKKVEVKGKLVEYPNNLNQQDLYYFMFAPTFCYELNFPRSPRIRYRFLMRRILEGTLRRILIDATICFLSQLFLLGILIALTQQWIVPTVKNSMKPFQYLDYPRFLERIMKLAIPNHFLWLIFFYAYFHSLLNILAELLRFADRTFYRDWWNANTVTYFWQNWNIPIHRWAKRHLYEPMIRSGYSKLQAGLIVFLLSAVYHELLVSVPLRMMKFWAFFGMLVQVPYSIFVAKFLSGNYGNIAVWLSLILGQPVAILMYYHDYFVTHYTVSNETSPSSWSFVYKQ
eukprot:gene18880-20780_t